MTQSCAIIMVDASALTFSGPVEIDLDNQENFTWKSVIWRKVKKTDGIFWDEMINNFGQVCGYKFIEEYLPDELLEVLLSNSDIIKNSGDVYILNKGSNVSELQDSCSQSFGLRLFKSENFYLMILPYWNGTNGDTPL